MGGNDGEPLIERLRAWLAETRDEADRAESPAEGPVEDALQVAEHLSAVRHEIKLLTKAVRAGEERSESSILALQAAIEQFERFQGQDKEAPPRAAQGLVEVIVELDESLRRGRRAIDSLRYQILKELDEHVQAVHRVLDEQYACQPWWRRVLCRPWRNAVKQVVGQHAVAAQAGHFDSLLEGYDLITARLKRAMDAHGITRMECVGRQVDPQAMTVVEAVQDRSRPPGIVVEEVRPGYYWNGRVLRCAEVCAVGQH